MKKAALALAVIAGFGLVLALGLFLGATARAWLPFGRGPTLLNTPTLLTRVQALSQLVTVKYVLEKAIVLDDARWYGENRVILMAHGYVKAGVDLGKLRPGDLSVSEKKIVITLPNPVVTDYALDENRTEVVDHATGLLRAFDKSLEQNARRDAVEALRRAALEDGILKDAEDRARTQLSDLFFQLGFTDVEFRQR